MLLLGSRRGDGVEEDDGKGVYKGTRHWPTLPECLQGRSWMDDACVSCLSLGGSVLARSSLGGHEAQSGVVVVGLVVFVYRLGST